MITRKVPVNGSVIAWARDEAGYTPDELSSALGISLETLQSWEAGDDHPNEEQFTSLHETVRRPSATFFLPEPPVEASLPAELRTTAGSFNRRLTPEEILLLRQHLRMQEIASWILRDKNSSPVSLNRYSIDDDPVQAGETERAKSGIAVKQQGAWTLAFRGSPNRIFSEWRSFLEDNGVLVLQLPMPTDSLRGFVSWNDFAPMLAVNFSHHPFAQIFSIFHEYAHLLTRCNAACLGSAEPQTDNSELENWCDRFAASFLISSGVLVQIAKSKGVTQQTTAKSVSTVAELAEMFSVSPKAMMLRLQDLKLSANTLCDNIHAQEETINWKVDTAQEVVDIMDSARRFQEYGTRAIAILLDARENKRLNTHDLTDYVDLNTQEIDELKSLLDYSKYYA